MPSRFRLSFFVFLAAIAAPVAASGPTFWTVATSTEFLQGRSDGVYLSLEGVVTAGPRLTNRLTSSPAQIWSLTEAPDGTLWAGTGGDGRVLRLRPGQPEEMVFDASENNIFAIAADATRVFAASSPDGRVYRIDAAGAAQPFFDPEEKYIWSLSFDAQGRLWVATGNPAAIYRVDQYGTSQLVYKPTAAHAVVLARDSQGRMLAGTESPGRLYRFDANDRPFVLLDSGMTELSAIAPAADGAVYAAAIARGDASPSAGESTAIAVTTASTTPSPTATTTPSPPAPPKRGTVFRIEASGVWEEIWESPDVVYDLATAADGSVLAATGPSGRLYRIGRTREVWLHTGVDAKQITRFARGGAAAAPGAFATANPGRVVTIADGVQSPATYYSSIRDSASVATWGQLRWESSGSTQLFTRSGNTAEPDDSWSPWSTPYKNSAGENITSPPARYLQWKAELTSSAAPARLTSVTVAYLPRNNRPSVTSITVHPPGVVFQKPFANEDGAIAGLDERVADSRRPPGDNGPTPPPPGRRMFQKGLQTLAWKAEDADNDRLLFTLQYRRDGETAWQDLRADLSDTIFVWDTSSMTDGRYALRVLASDLPTNSADRALTGERTSETITIDNSPPAVTTEVTRTSAGVRLAVRVTDAQSPIQKVEYSVGGGAWQLVYPVDGLADAPDERYEIPLANESEATRIVVRATDLLQNVTSKAAVVR
ncbi:MAG TPA: two-component regulator propeller domain-containing protein [Vicinamibacterales bacterium]|nr:two-component regulator propeller domain-containing protein [Vicinamibacterales bacterium]